MITYLDIISVTEMKKYLRVEVDFFDDIVKDYIESAFMLFEKKTNHYTATQTKSYEAGKVYYDYPLSDYTDVIRNGLMFTAKSDITVNVGYSNAVQVPADIKFAVKKLVEGMFLAEEKSEPFTISDSMAMEVIKEYKRYIA